MLTKDVQVSNGKLLGRVSAVKGLKKQNLHSAFSLPNINFGFFDFYLVNFLLILFIFYLVKILIILILLS